VIQRRALRKPPDQGGWNMFCTSLAGLDVFSPAGNQALRGNGAAAWFGCPSDAELERLREAWFAAPDLDAQKKIAAEIQIQAFQDCRIIRLGCTIDNHRIVPICLACCMASRCSGTCNALKRLLGNKCIGLGCTASTRLT
jgi:hypothetical protein